MRCPICKQGVTYDGNPFRPFCSERCKMIDLDNWLEERYRAPERMGAGEEGPGQGKTTEAKGERD
ncbi:MAG TPA: DNA gyrase inhibitor YacG [Terriglobia bacterium]|nr:DNA gyrase inhibitor YacG [Terriglobia bacterium]